MKSFEKQLKNILKEYEREIINESEKINLNQRINNQSFILDSESENLLNYILMNDKDFPKCLKNLFFKDDGSRIDFTEDNRLRALISELLNNGLITLKWGDGVPIFGRIEQKGRSYFEMKNIYKNNLKREEVEFKYLDEESEKVMKRLVKDFRDSASFIVPNDIHASVVENLLNLGYLISKKGVEYYTDGEYVCCARLTQAAKTYDELKERNEKQMSEKIIYNYGTINNLSHSAINNSQIGNLNATQNIQITNTLIEETMKEILTKIEKFGLSEENKNELRDIVEDIREKNEKKPNQVKRAIKSLCDFAKDVGCGVLTAFLTTKFGFTN